MNWEFPFKSECKNCLDFHSSMLTHLETIEEWRKKYEALEKHTQELQEIIKQQEAKELGFV